MSDNGWNGFVNIGLEKEHRKAIKALAKGLTGEDVVNKICEYLDDGYRVSFSPDIANQAIVITMTCKDEDNANSGFAFSQRHSDPIVAFAAMVFCHEELAQRGSWQNIGQTQLGFNW